MTHSFLQEYNESVADVPPLGKVVWYGVEKLRLRHAELVDLLEAEDLGRFAPTKPSAADCFRRVASAAQRKGVEIDDDEVARTVPAALIPSATDEEATTDKIRQNILIRDLASTDDSITKRVVAETVNPRGKTLSYTEVADLIFLRSSEKVHVRLLVPPGTHPAAELVAEGVVPEFAATVGTVDANAIRTLLRKVLDENQAIMVRTTGSIYFAPRSYTDVMLAVGRAMEQIPNVDYTLVSLPDEPALRAKVKRAIELESVEAADALIREAQEVLSGEAPVTEAQVTSFLARYKRVAEKVDGYSGLLQDGLDGCAARMEVANQAIKRLLSKVEAA